MLKAICAFGASRLEQHKRFVVNMALNKLELVGFSFLPVQKPGMEEDIANGLSPSKPARTSSRKHCESMRPSV